MIGESHTDTNIEYADTGEKPPIESYRDDMDEQTRQKFDFYSIRQGFKKHLSELRQFGVFTDDYAFKPFEIANTISRNPDLSQQMELCLSVKNIEFASLLIKSAVSTLDFHDPIVFIPEDSKLTGHIQLALKKLGFENPFSCTIKELTYMISQYEGTSNHHRIVDILTKELYLEPKYAEEFMTLTRELLSPEKI